MAKQVTNIPELTTTERNALSSVPTNTIIFNTTTNQVELWNGATWQTFGGSGSVTSVALADSTGLFNITGSPVTTSGTLTLASFQSQAQHAFFAAPSGSTGAPTFRAIVASDIPTLNQNTTGTASNVTGIVASANGGTGVNNSFNLTVGGTSSINGTFSGTSSGTNTGDQTITLTGDITGSGTGSFATTLATVNGNVGSFGSSTSIPSFTVNAKGLITAASGNAVIAPAGTLSGTTLNSTVVSSSLTSVGTITTGVWNGTTIAIANGGTGQTTKAAAFDALSPMTTGGDIIYGGASGTGTRLANGTSGYVLTSNGGTTAPSWQVAPSAVTSQYYSGYFTAGDSWTVTSSTYADFTASGSPSLNQRQAAGITVTAAGSNLPGITFTPPTASAVYLVTAVAVGMDSLNNWTGLQLTDGTTVIQQRDWSSPTTNVTPVTLSGIFVPGTASAVTVKLQGAAGGVLGTLTLGDPGSSITSSSLEWTLIRIA